MKIAMRVLGLALIAAPLSVLAEDGDAERGRKLYEDRCIGCHSLDVNRVGPRHRGVFGRRAGTIEGYRYSEALARSAVVWTDRTLDAWLTDPGKFIPGSRMGFRLSRPDDRADIIAYLKRNGADQD